MDKIEEFLKTYQSKSTLNTYKYALNKFFKCVGIKPEKYFGRDRNYEEDLRSFQASIKDKPPKTVKTLISAVRSFFVENDVELGEKFWRGLRRKIKGNRAWTVDQVPSNQELRRILSHMDVKGRALCLTLASSGMRIGEALQLQLDDVELNNEPAKITIQAKYTKTGNSRMAFISQEAKETLEEWLRVREKYINGAVGKSHIHVKTAKDERIFPFDVSTAYIIWQNALSKSGFLKKDKATGRNTIHPHVLRKFFRTKLGAIIPVDVTEALMGHEGYLTEVYRKYSVEDLAKFYLQGEPNLSVFTDTAEVGKLRQEVEEKNKQLQTVINGLVSENMNLKEKMKQLDDLAKVTTSTLQEIMPTIKAVKEGSYVIKSGAEKAKEELGMDKTRFVELLACMDAELGYMVNNPEHSSIHG
ncbi:MAG: site-specific integrase [Candidatus Bathyarchaeota archaeon]